MRQRQLLTSLLASLSRSPTALTPLPHAPLPEDVEAVLMTLHVLFPSVVLPALDLLDRNFVSRVYMVDDRCAQGASWPTCHGDTRSLGDGHCGNSDTDFASSPLVQRIKDEHAHSTRLYIVQSVALSAARRRHRAPTSLPSPRIVHVDAWSCSYVIVCVEIVTTAAIKVIATINGNSC
ncbi:hypothetical protein XA68_10622 [Ophiocordyceps unilateralis]|uniref:Uncharacterized protein n=1 Tax=Ophiocordyceps unilateralis TaxID=268505 RepID=A0A2A9P2F6_OPHUN|nr:hypothetical protein XA68_10622 [Ophiocordyceps unilateralis]